MNTWYKRYQDPDGTRRSVLGLVYKDLATGMKYMEEFVDPKYTYYVADENHRVPYNRMFIPEEHTIPVTVPYEEIEKDIAKRIGMQEYYFDNIRSRNSYENKRLHMHPDIFNSDSDIQDNIRFEFGRSYQNRACPLTMAFFDIEVDAINAAGDFPEPGECPVDAISIYFSDRQEMYSLLLETADNMEQIQKFKDEVAAGIISKEYYDFVCQNLGGPEKMKKIGVENITFRFAFYKPKDEIRLIADMFRLINKFKPDFALAWNQAFDLPYLMARCKVLGYDPADVMCHPDSKHKFCDYYIDERNKNDFGERGDFCVISGYTAYLDQMIHFASRRKATRYTSYGLDFIATELMGVHKYDYKHITTSLLKLSRLNYKVYAMYNMMDVICQVAIEAKAQDMLYVHGKALMNNTRYQKVHRQTVYLANRGIKEFRQRGFVFGNNTNRFSEKPESRYSGAFVASPQQLNDYSKMRILNQVVLLFNNLVDFDFSSLYPSILRELNITSFTQIGMVIIAAQVHAKENRQNTDWYSRGGQYLENIQSNVWLETANRWFHLADYETLTNDVEEFFTEVAIPSNYTVHTKNYDGTVDPMYFHGPDAKPFIEPMVFDSDVNRHNNEIGRDYVLMDMDKARRFREHAAKYPNQQFATFGGN